MKKYILFLLFLIFALNINVYPQSTDSKSNDDNNSFQKHSWALQFAVGSNFTLQSFDGLMFSAKYHFSTKTAFRFGVGILGGSNNATQETFTGSVPLKNDNENIYLFGNYIIYPHPDTKFILFFGAGPRLSFKHSLRQNYYSDMPEKVYSTETTSWAAGLQFNLGIEWFAVKNLSLFGEYQAYGTYGKTYNNNLLENSAGDLQSFKHVSNDWFFNGTTARLGLSVYF